MPFLVLCNIIDVSVVCMQFNATRQYTRSHIDLRTTKFRARANSTLELAENLQNQDLQGSLHSFNTLWAIARGATTTHSKNRDGLKLSKSSFFLQHTHYDISSNLHLWLKWRKNIGKISHTSPFPAEILRFRFHWDFLVHWFLNLVSLATRIRTQSMVDLTTERVKTIDIRPCKYRAHTHRSLISWKVSQRAQRPRGP